MEDISHSIEDNSEDDDIDSLQPYYPAIQGCRSVEEFQCINRVEEGMFT